MKNITENTSKNIHGYTTRASHLKRLGENDEAAWNEFYTKYRAMIFAIGIARGLSPGECEDLLQEVSFICSKKLQNFVYDPERCRFRSFLSKIVTNVAFNIFRDKNKIQTEELSDDYSIVPELDIQFMQEYERFLLEKSFLILKNSISSENFLAFDMLVCQNLTVKEVVARTGFSTSKLYTLKHRYLKKLQEIIRELLLELKTPPKTVQEAE